MQLFLLGTSLGVATKNKPETRSSAMLLAVRWPYDGEKMLCVFDALIRTVSTLIYRIRASGDKQNRHSF